MLHPTASGNSNGDECEACYMKPQRRLWIGSDRVNPPFLDFFASNFRSRFKSENNLHLK
jgi:hypothetical protein